VLASGFLLMVSMTRIGAAAVNSPSGGTFKLEGTPLTDSNGGGAVTDAVGLVNELPGNNVALTRSQDGSYHMDGTAFGQDIPPTDLWVHETAELGGTPDGATTSDASSGDVSLREGLLASPVGKITVALLHELKHLALTKEFPEFAAECPECAEQVCYASAATDACALANDCDLDLNGAATDSDETEREDLVRAADEQNQACEQKKAENPNACPSCEASIMPAIPACPGPCQHEPCPEDD
jgi:hypothetical protein